MILRKKIVITYRRHLAIRSLLMHHLILRFACSASNTGSFITPAAVITITSCSYRMSSFVEDHSQVDVESNLSSVLSRLRAAHAAADAAARSPSLPRLVAVSKTKPKELVIRAYAAGHRDFGENYVQELQEKSTDKVVLDKCPEIRWHFIGNCQTNKVPKLGKCPNLTCVETITSVKLADKLQAQFKQADKQLKVMIQVQNRFRRHFNMQLLL